MSRAKSPLRRGLRALWFCAAGLPSSPAVAEESDEARLAGWALLGAGLAAAGTGIGFGVASARAEADHKRATTGAEKRRTAEAAWDRADAANVLFAGAGVLGVVGTTLLLVNRETGPTLAPGPDGAVVGWSGRF